MKNSAAMVSYIRSIFRTANTYDEPEFIKDIPLMMSEFEPKYLSKCLKISRPNDSSLEELIKLSAEFPVKIPVDSVRCDALKHQPDITTDILEHHANSAYPLLHEAVVTLYIDFLEHKKKYGSRAEKLLYADMGLVHLVQRFLDKRAVTFCGPRDCYVLTSGETGVGGWETVGTDNEKPPLVLENCLSYDEIKLSAFLALTCYSVFTNDGNRRNRGKTSDATIRDIERHGVIVGIVGPRLSTGDLLEAEEIVIKEAHNTRESGYGTESVGPKHEWRQLWSKFYGVDCLPAFNEVQNARRWGNDSLGSRFVKLNERWVFDNEIYSKRISIAAESFLLEAESRAAAANKPAFVHVVGIGLGAWKISIHQEKVFLDSFSKCLKNLSKVLLHVSDVNFAWFEEKSCGGVKDGDLIGEGDTKIRIHFSNRPPHSKLDDPNKLLIVSYAWDGNSLPGNDFWINQLDTAGDPACAASTQVAELQNSHMNRKISGTNLHVASSKWGVLHIAEYARRKFDSYT